MFHKRITLDEKIQYRLLWLLRFSVLVVISWALAFGHWETFFISWLALILMFAPELVFARARIVLPIEFTFVLAVFVYLSVFLGEIADIYHRVWWWDGFLHIGSGLIIGFAGFLLLYVLMIQKKLKMSPFLIAMFSFSVGMAAGGVWEIFEYLMDSVFGLNMQKSGLQDTMWDLIVNAIGSLLVAWAGYAFIKSNDRGHVISRIIARFLKANPKLVK